MIFKLEATYKDYLWGGEKLRTHFNKETDCSPLAESWEVSCHPDGESVIGSGVYNGTSLTKFLKNCPIALGKKGEFIDRFPLLVKLIDAKLDLSVQVHPDDDYGMRVENEYGKTEVWYVLDAEPGAQLIMGFQRKTSREEVQRATEEGKLMDLLHQVPVQGGDVFFIESGTVHGIGGGITLIEIQQNSNTTYRVYDYDRVGKDGKKRPLHLEKALDVMTYGPATRRHHDDPVIASCDYFHVEAYIVDKTLEIQVTDESFQTVTCVDGELLLIQNEEALSLLKGQSAFITAENSCYELKGEGKVVLSRLP